MYDVLVYLYIYEPGYENSSELEPGNYYHRRFMNSLNPVYQWRNYCI